MLHSIHEITIFELWTLSKIRYSTLFILQELLQRRNFFMIMITLKSFYIDDCPGSLLVLRAYHQVTESPAGPLTPSTWYSSSLSPNDPPQLWWWIVKSRFTLNIKYGSPPLGLMMRVRGKMKLFLHRELHHNGGCLQSLSDDNAFSLVGRDISRH